MEPIVLSDDLNWEARRMAAVFGIPECERDTDKQDPCSYIYLKCEISVEVQIEEAVIELMQVTGKHGGHCDFFRQDWSPIWNAYGSTQKMCDLLARALYCLGFEDERIFDELQFSFSAHDKMELRLSMPREFWPKTWLDEEGK